MRDAEATARPDWTLGEFPSVHTAQQATRRPLGIAQKPVERAEPMLRLRVVAETTAESRAFVRAHGLADRYRDPPATRFASWQNTLNLALERADSPSSAPTSSKTETT